MPFFIVSILVQLTLVVHIIKSGRPMTWVFIVMFFPLVGSLAYMILELLPEWNNSPAARNVRRKLDQKLNPDRAFNAASLNLDVADTVQNAMALAEECMLKGRYREARELYQRSLRGIHADDPELLMGLARAQFGEQDYPATLATLDLFKQHHPKKTSADGHLLYARALEGAGQLEAAIEEYEALVRYYPGPEPACRLALICKARGASQRATSLLEQVVKQSRIGGRHYQQLHGEWVALAQRELQG